MNEPRPMTEQEQRIFQGQVECVRRAWSALELSGVEDEDVAVAKARLDNWLKENSTRWAA